MQLVLVAHRSRTSLKIRHIGTVVGYYQRALKLSCVSGVDAEIAAQFHRATHAFGNIHKRSVAEYGTVQCGKEIVAVWHHRTEIFPHQLRVILYGVAYGAEYDTLFRKFLLKGRLHRNGIHNGIHCGAAKCETFLQGDAELVESLHQLRVNLLVLLFLLLSQGVGIV